MITVRGRELVIPVAERQIGTQFDNNSETRQFKINRLTVGGIDISNLDFRIDLRYGKEIKDTDILTKEVSDEYVILTWTVSAASVKQVGTVFIALRGSDDFGTVKWATNQGYLYVGDTINTPEGAETALSELEKLEKRIDQKTESLDAAESSRVEAEKIRQENETARLNNEAEWQKQGEAAVEAAKTAVSAAGAAKSDAEAAAGSASTANSAAQTATEAENAASASAEAAGESEETASNAAQTATKAQTSASASAEAAAGSAETAGNAAQTATKAQTSASASAEAAAGSASTANSAAQTATQKASDASNSASEAASDANVVKELIKGLGGFDGKASSVSAVDILGLLGTEGATSTVQALIDVIADKVLNQLLLRSNVVNNALTTEEGYALDARMGKSLQDQINTQNSNLGWSDTISLGKNGCGINLRYRYNTGMKLCEIYWDGTINETITAGTSGYAWEGFPVDKAPQGNTFIPIPPMSGLCIRWYPVAADGVGNKFTLVSFGENVSNVYCCGRYMYNYS